MNKLLPALATAVLVAAATAGCGGSGAGSGQHGLSSSEQKVADHMSSYLAKNGNGSISKKDAQCIAEGWVGRSGVPTLKKNKVLTGSGQVNTSSNTRITKPMASDYADALLDCIDYAKLQSQAVAKVNPGIDAKKMADCFGKAMPRTDEKQLLVSTMTGNASSQLASKNAEAIKTCQQQAQQGSPQKANPQKGNQQKGNQ
ncbi:MAG TPA: hypothetical protein VFR99_07790 [Marmoricola sp.]|nr:hypothetical protein [Marmoricola sp.]